MWYSEYLRRFLPTNAHAISPSAAIDLRVFSSKPKILAASRLLASAFSAKHAARRAAVLGPVRQIPSFSGPQNAKGQGRKSLAAEVRSTLSVRLLLVRSQHFRRPFYLCFAARFEQSKRGIPAQRLRQPPIRPPVPFILHATSNLTDAPP